MTTVRPATPDDAAAVIAVRIASWNATYTEHLPENAWDDYDVGAATGRARSTRSTSIRTHGRPAPAARS